MVQSFPEASPVMHQAHTTWFFETFVLGPFLKDYKPFREEFRWLFNSYYNSLGEDIPEKRLRASFCRPSLTRFLPSASTLTRRWRDCSQPPSAKSHHDAQYWA